MSVSDTQIAVVKRSIRPLNVYIEARARYNSIVLRRIGLESRQRSILQSYGERRGRLKMEFCDLDKVAMQLAQLQSELSDLIGPWQDAYRDLETARDTARALVRELGLARAGDGRMPARRTGQNLA